NCRQENRATRQHARSDQSRSRAGVETVTFMTNFQRSDLNLINTWLEPGANAYSTSMSCFQQLSRARMLKRKPLKRLSASTRQHTGLKTGVNKIQSSARKRDS